MSHSVRPAILVLALSLLCTLQVSAQSGGPLIGFHLGGSVATLSGDDLPDFTSKMGLKAGASAAFPVSGNIRVHTGLSYAEKGTKLADSDFDEALSIDYIELPVLLRYNVPVAGAVAPHFMLGPAIAFQIGCEFTEEFEGESGSFDCEDEGLEAASVDVGVMAGAGIAYAVSGPMAVTLQILYNFGFTNIDSAEDADDIVNRAWSFLLGIEFPILR